MTSRAFQRSTQLYSLLLRLYPRSFRKEFESEMLYVFTQSLIEAQQRGKIAVIQIWSMAIPDLLHSAVSERIQYLQEGASMKTQKNDLIMDNKVFAWIALVVGVLLLIPVIAMQFSTGVNWTALDFIVAGVLLYGAAAVFVLLARRTAHRLILAGVVGFVLLYLWAELAVGILFHFGS